MIYYIYDGTFEGLLTSVFYAYERSEKPDDIINRDKIKQLFFAETYDVISDESKAERVIAAVSKKIDSLSTKNIIYTYLSGVNRFEIMVFDYIREGLKKGPGFNYDITSDIAISVNNLSRKVGFEVHRLKGLVRFVELENSILYASISPDFNVTTLLAPHFIKRLSNEKWIIHDAVRKVAIYYDSKKLHQIDIKEDFKEILKKNRSIDGDIYETLWSEYFKNIAISERKNLKLQKQYMPKRYWKHLIEKNHF